jgi:hypothetical protein
MNWPAFFLLFHFLFSLNFHYNGIFLLYLLLSFLLLLGSIDDVSKGKAGGDVRAVTTLRLRQERVKFNKDNNLGTLIYLSSFLL